MLLHHNVALSSATKHLVLSWPPFGVLRRKTTHHAHHSQSLPVFHHDCLKGVSPVIKSPIQKDFPKVPDPKDLLLPPWPPQSSFHLTTLIDHSLTQNHSNPTSDSPTDKDVFRPNQRLIYPCSMYRSRATLTNDPPSSSAGE